MKIITLLILIQFLLFPCFGQIVINEIMYNPSDESKGEFIELYNPNAYSVNLDGWNISDGGSDIETLKGFGGSSTVLISKRYAIITDEDTNVSVPEGITHLTTGDNSICTSGLKNSGERISLWNASGTLIDQVNYTSPPIPSCSDGESLQRINSSRNLSNNPTNWIALPPSPGKQNFYEDATLELLEISTEEKIYANKTTTIFVKILNHGKEEVIDISVNLSINNIYTNPVTANISGMNITEIQFEWMPTHPGNYIILASLDGQTINNTISVLPQIQKNTTLDVYLETEILLDLEYTSLFEIIIENKKEVDGSCEKKDNITIQYNITNSTGNLIKENNFTREIGCSGYSNTGEWTPNQIGNFTLCGKIINATTNFNNASVCKTIIVIDSKTIPCNLTIQISSPLIWSVNEKSKYYIFVNDSSGNYQNNQIEITYWIEDYFGNFIKNPYTTASIKTNKNSSRDYTPKFDCGTSA